VKQFELQLIVLFIAAVSSAQQFPPSAASTGATSDERGTQTASPAAQQGRDSTTATAPSVPACPDSAEGLERMMGDMISLQRQGQTEALAPYLQSLVLPQTRDVVYHEVWYRALRRKTIRRE
jgi:hypothetical protein